MRRRAIDLVRTWTCSAASALAVGCCIAAAPSLPAEDRTPAVELAAQLAPLSNQTNPPGHGILTAADEAFLDDLQQRGIRFFVDEQHPVTGLMPDRSRADGGPSNNVSSTASVGFGLTAICIAHERGWMSRDEAYERCLRVLRFLRDRAPHERGHFYHFIDMATGERVWQSEASNIDTALLIAGALVVRQHFEGTEAAKIADELYRRVEWGWLLDKETGWLHMGYRPEEGILKAHWNGYSEHPLLYLLAIGSPTHPIPASSWNAWHRTPVMQYAGLTFMQCPPLFTHQYPQCWFDLRGLRDDHADYFRNSQLATLAQRQWTIDEASKQFGKLGPNLWGLTASDSADGYKAWGGPPTGEGDGSVVPAAPAGSLVFAPRLCLDALITMKAVTGEQGYRKYGFVDAFNLHKDWFNTDVIGIDVGPTVVMAENMRSGFVWKRFMSCPEATLALKRAGFRSVDAGGKLPASSAMFEPAASK